MELTDPLELHFRLNTTQKRALAHLRIRTVRDLLYHFPSRYENVADIKPVRALARGDRAIVYGRLRNLGTRKAFRSKTPIAEGFLEDRTGRAKIIWFHQPYLAKMLADGDAVKVAGKVTGSGSRLYIANPEVEKVAAVPENFDASLFGAHEVTPPAAFYPLYPETKGITSRWFYHALARVRQSGALDTLSDPIDPAVLKRYNLPTLKTALVWIHTPKRERDSEAARKRFAFEEVLLIQIGKLRARRAYQSKPSFRINCARNDINEFIARFSFQATKAQLRAIDEILRDFRTPHAMSRLLEGDVGSGKTAVAAASAYAAVTTRPQGQDFGNLQIAYMAPTEILAAQQFDSFVELFAHLPINIGLITSSGCKKFPSKVKPTEATSISRPQLLKWVANGEIATLLGTHALIQKAVTFKDLAYVIIDEQHRFGTAQRQKLTRKDEIAPHLLSMTATPIPRTLALTIYGDLDLTILDEMPAGRKHIITEVVAPRERESAYEKVRKELAKGRQAYVICPRIDEPDPQKEQALQTKSVKEECARLKKDVFPNQRLDILHGKLQPKEKDGVMQRFLDGDTDILVATSVVEVGVNVPNATVIIIEGAERFGLAQLHQLRGRVLRSTHQSYCFVFTDSKSKSTRERLQALQKAKNGFELAEYDLKIRGAGELYGRHQSGLSDVAMEAMKNIKMVEAARAEAQQVVDVDSTLAKHPELKTLVEHKAKDLHFE